MLEPGTLLFTKAAAQTALKLCMTLYGKYLSWNNEKKLSAKHVADQKRADALMYKINLAILQGGSSDDPEIAELVEEFEELIETDVKPAGHQITTDWIRRSRKPAEKAPKPAAKKAAAKPAAKAAAKPAAKKAAAKPAAKAAAKPAAKKAAAKPAAKAAAKPAAKKAAAKPAARAPVVTVTKPSVFKSTTKK
ncbi:hypothetical protein ACO0LG_10980 [Undibacterium sp. Ji42W]|uniref:hypothetical protein n=1 Tax=Undibacterium sp. Ji42W TaxID=3413039 RepID=UPI003BF37C3A